MGYDRKSYETLANNLTGGVVTTAMYNAQAAEIERLKAAVAEPQILRIQVVDLKVENNDLRAEVERLKADLAWQTHLTIVACETKDTLRAQINGLLKQNVDEAEINDALRARVEEITNQTNEYSRNVWPIIKERDELRTKVNSQFNKLCLQAVEIKKLKELVESATEVRDEEFKLTEELRAQAFNILKAILTAIVFILPWICFSQLPGTKAEPYVIGFLYLVMLYFLGRFLLWVYEINKEENRYDDW